MNYIITANITDLISSSENISGDSPPWTHRNCPFMRAAKGRQSKESIHRSYTASEYLILPSCLVLYIYIIRQYTIYTIYNLTLYNCIYLHKIRQYTIYNVQCTIWHCTCTKLDNIQCTIIHFKIVYTYTKLYNIKYTMYNGTIIYTYTKLDNIQCTIVHNVTCKVYKDYNYIHKKLHQSEICLGKNYFN